MARLRDDQIQWILSLDAKGVQSELVNISSASKKAADDNKTLQKEMKEAEKQMRATEKAMRRMEEAGRTNEDAYLDMEATVESITHELSNYRRQIEANNASIRENDRLTEQMVRTLQLEDMTMNQLRGRARELERQLNATSISAEPDVYRSLETQLQAVRARMGEVSAGTQQATSTFKGGLMVLAGNLMTKAIDMAVQYAMALKDWVANGLEAAGVIEGVARAFQKLDKTGDLLDKLRNQTRNLISDDDLQKAAVRADKYKINIEEVGNLLEFAGRRATDMGKSVQDFQERIIDGIGKESKIILDDLGLTSTEINAAIAETGDFASGVIKVVNEELEKQGKLELTAADIRQQKTVAWENAQGAVGEKLLWIEKIWNQFSIDFAGDVQEWASETLPGLIQKVIDLYNWFVDLYNESEGVRVIFEGLGFVFQTSWNTIKAILNTAVINIKSLGNLIKAAFTLDWDLLKQAGEEYAESMKNTWKGALDETEDDFRNMAKRISSNKMDRMEMPLPGENEIAGTGQLLKKNVDPNATKKQKATQLLALEQLETKHNERLYSIKERYRKGDIKSEAEFNRETFAQEQANLVLREELLNRFIKSTSDKELKSDLEKKLAEVRNKRLDQELKFRSDLEKILLAADPVAKEKREYEERLSAYGLFGVEKEKMTSEQLEAFELLERQHREKLEQIDHQAEARKNAQSEKEFNESFSGRKEEMQLELNDLMQIQAATGRLGFEAEMEVHMKRLQMLQEEIQARRDAGLEIESQTRQLGRVEAQMTNTIKKENDKRTADYNQYANSIAGATTAFFSGQQSGLEAFGGSMIDIMFDILSQIINQKIVEATAVAVAEQAKAAAIAAAMPDSVFTFGASAAARTAAIGAIIMGALQVAKGALKGMIGKKKGGSSSSSSGGGSSSSGSIKVIPRSFAEGGHNAGVDGGYTGDGGRYDVAGMFQNGATFHRGEYIVASPELAQPEVVAMVRRLESIRRQRTSANPSSSFAEGGANCDYPNNMFLGDNKLAEKMYKVLEMLEQKDFTPKMGASELQAGLDDYNKTVDRFSQNKKS